MSYSTILARQQEILQGLALLGVNNVTLGDYRVLDRGYDACAILWPAEAMHGENTLMPGMTFGDPDDNQEIEWITEVRFFRRFVLDADSLTNFIALRQAIMDVIMGSPSLTSLTLSTLTNIKWARWGGTIEQPVMYYETDATGKPAGPFWIMEVFAWVVREWVTVATGQYP